MAARPTLQPGVFKDRRNYAGGYTFVDPELVEGRLRRGFDIVNGVVDPLRRAVAMMALITEVHPFLEATDASSASSPTLSCRTRVRLGW